jgi:RHS repeat-associated protein
MAYDPMGRLQSSTVGTAVTQYFYSGTELVAELDGAGNTLRRYVHGPGTDEPIVWYEGATLANRNYLHADERGSIIATSDGSGVATVYKFGPFGEPTSWTGSRFQYTGQAAIPEAHLYYYKARIYSPSLGRFLQTDPVGTADDLNLYAYGRNDPINRVDVSGNWSAAVHLKVMSDAFGPTMGKAMSSRSIYQDLIMGSYNYMHYLRDPGQSPSEAVAKWGDFVKLRLDEAKAFANSPIPYFREQSLGLFTDAVHAIMDSFSPVHSKDGVPQEFNPKWSYSEVVAHGHSPFDNEGEEGTKNLTPEVEKKMIKRLRQASQYVYGDSLAGSGQGTPLPHCTIGASCKSGSDYEFWN